MKKRMIFLFIVFILFLVFIDNVSANFVCGEVKPPSDFSASWIETKIFYTQNVDLITKCKISPDNYRFCCDPLQIPGISWGVGKQINSQIIDKEKGFFSDKVSLQISGEGYDVFPIIEIEKGIDINPEIRGAYFNISGFNFSIKSANIFDRIFYAYGQDIQECEQCNSLNVSFSEISFGENKFEIRVSNEEINYTEEFLFNFLEYIDFDRKFQCDGCSGNKVSPNREINVTLNVNLSHYSNGEIIEYIPSGWEILDEDLLLLPYSDTHNKLIWEVSGKDIEIRYRALSPGGISTKKETFQSSFEEIYSSEDKVITSKFFLFDIFSRLKKISKLDKNASEILNYPMVSETQPLVYSPDTDYIKQIVVFPNSEINKSKIRFSNRFIKPGIKQENLKSAKMFMFKTNINISQIEKIWYKFDFNITGIDNPVFYKYDDELKEAEEMYFEIVEDENGIKNYLIETKEQGFFYILNKENE